MSGRARDSWAIRKGRFELGAPDQAVAAMQAMAPGAPNSDRDRRAPAAYRMCNSPQTGRKPGKPPP